MQEYIEQYLERYLPRKDIIRRLPVSLTISKFWPELQKARRSKSKDIPLYDQNGLSFWWVLTDKIINQSEEVISLARREITFSTPEFELAFKEAVLDEAIYSSIIEGAFTTKREAREYIKKGNFPKNKSEQMVKNNFDALTYVLEHLDLPITEQTVFDIYSFVIKDTLEGNVPTDCYRNEKVVVQASSGETVFTPPPAAKVPNMMSALMAFIADNDISPVMKACVVHFYFVYVHPFVDGNGRTARALSYMILLQAGYDFFRYFSISSVLVDERAQYYRAIKNVEDDENDLTYFIEYYTSMLARAIKQMEERLIVNVVIEQRIKALETLENINPRVIAGAKWILASNSKSITVEAWRKKFKVVTETARKDLNKLESAGIVHRRLAGRRFEFDVIK